MKDKEVYLALIIPVYKREKELLSLLKSLDDLDCQKFDIIIVNNSESEVRYEKKRNKKVEVIELGKNYGATAGFNAGIKFALENKKYKYLWLLDSDLIVDNSCLNKLLKVIESDNSIGIVGPKILNCVDKDLIVEIGANFDLNTGNINPVRCNEFNSNENSITSVDYLGTGISLIRSDAIRKAGLMDENYHFLWDDIDYCLNLKKCGYKVVSVSDAVVYHPPFTEKREQKSAVYYGIRNMLLLVSKHGSILNIVRFNYNSLRRNLKNIFLALLNGNMPFEKFRFLAFKDFICNRFGEYRQGFIEETNLRKLRAVDLNLSGDEKLIVFSNSTSEVIKNLVDFLKEVYPDLHISLLCRGNRKNIFRNLKFDEIIAFDDKDNFIMVYSNLLRKLIKSNFDLAINPNVDIQSPYEFAFKDVLIFCDKKNEFYESENNIYSFWKPSLAILISEVLSVLLFPLLTLFSFRYRFFKSEN